MLHDDVVAVRVDADVAVAGEGELHHAAEDAVRAMFAAHAVDYVVGEGIVEPLTVVNLLVGRFRRWQKREIAHDFPVVLNHETSCLPDIVLHNFYRRVAVNPLLPVARCLHLLPCLVEDWHNVGNVGCGGRTDDSRIVVNHLFCNLLDIWVGTLLETLRATSLPMYHLHCFNTSLCANLTHINTRRQRREIKQGVVDAGGLQRFWLAKHCATGQIQYRDADGGVLV